MKRRDAIKTLLVASGGAFITPSWAFNWSEKDIPEFTGNFTKNELSLISSIADTIIPSNGKIGALSVKVDTYLAALISECFDEDFQADVKKHLGALEKSSRKKYEKPFGDCSQGEREKLLLAMEKRNENEEAFFEFMKSRTIKGFETSKEVMVNYHNYVMMPGFYDGNVDVEAG